ncbi:uncharacterized protein ACHE_11915S [Aspergillus chevalieri]|uniref:Uncharacterized protein n=1 Tax=Aspergillus chevalieri TaxID=182096 RepID=A0A7R7ZJM3_ASPCH|nr:uncharacterized protein ACHE_11915S [Aspergillus chevalieri]BCR84513.1 hypothetical protein ACHE_11915S [Aspergillus chevalieri]
MKGQGTVSFDFDCYLILCKGVSPILQRIDKDTDEANRKASGAAADPFRNVLKDKIPPKNPDWHKNEAFESPEEFPFASSAQEGSK